MNEPTSGVIKVQLCATRDGRYPYRAPEYAIPYVDSDGTATFWNDSVRQVGPVIEIELPWAEPVEDEIAALDAALADLQRKAIQALEEASDSIRARKAELLQLGYDGND